MHIYSKKAVVLLKSSDALQHGLKGFHLSQDFCRFQATRLHQKHVHDAHEASGPRKGPQPHRWDLQIFGRKQGLPLWQLQVMGQAQILQILQILRSGNSPKCV